MLRVGLRAASINRKYNFQINTDKSALFMCTPCSEWSSNNTLVDSFISHTVYASPILCMRRCLHITAQTKRRRRLMLWISSARCRTCHWHQLLLQLKSCAWHWQRGSGVFTCLDRLVFRIFLPSRDDKSRVHYGDCRCHCQHVSSTRLLHRWCPYCISAAIHCFAPYLAAWPGRSKRIGWCLPYMVGLSKSLSSLLRINTACPHKKKQRQLHISIASSNRS